MPAYHWFSSLFIFGSGINDSLVLELKGR